VIGSENVARYEAAVQKLALADREAIIGRLELQYSYEELAVALNKPTANAARVAVTRAMKRLVEQMRHAG
jgi:DNA-directed RNA polymerase specialized sigma24 family protein